MFTNGDLYKRNKIEKKSIGKKIMSKEQIKRFIMFYERITKHMLKTPVEVCRYFNKYRQGHSLKSMKIR